MTDNPNIRTKSSLTGVIGAVVWALIVVLGLLPFFGMAVTTSIYVGQTVLIGLLFGFVQILESGASKYFNLYQQARAENMDKLFEIIERYGREDDEAEGTNES